MRNKLTRFEITRLLSARAFQISLGAPPLIKPKKGSTSFEIAKAELGKKVLPLSVLRVFPNSDVVRIELK